MRYTFGTQVVYVVDLAQDCLEMRFDGVTEWRKPKRRSAIEQGTLPFGGRECLLEFLRQRVGNDADLSDLAGQAPPPAGANGDGVTHLEAIGARARNPRHNKTMLADDLDHWLARTHHRAGADQDFADNTIDHRSKVAIVVERDQLLQGAVGLL